MGLALLLCSARRIREGSRLARCLGRMSLRLRVAGCGLPVGAMSAAGVARGMLVSTHISPGTAIEQPKGGEAMPMGQERTKEQLYSQAKRLGVKGRSKMNKGQLKAALARHGH